MTTNKQHGFTIIEVVITIAIGAAVMALVLNAVAGARRSQRNNARAADVNQVAAAYNQYLATRNELPEHFGELAGIVDSGFGHYTPDRINATGSWSSSLPGTSVPGFCTPTAADTGTPDKTGCEDATIGSGVGVWTAPNATGVFAWDIGYATFPTPRVKLSDPTDAGAADYMLVINQAKCQTNGIQPIGGGIREAVIVYRLEGQDNTICLEI